MTRPFLTLGVATVLFPAVAAALNGGGVPSSPITNIPTATAEDFSKVYWNNDLRFETADKQFTTRIGGRIQFDGWYTDDRGQGGTDGSDSDGWQFRRARLYVLGTVYGNIHYKAQYDFAGSTSSGAPDWRDVYIEIEELLGPAYLRAGQFFMPFGLDTQQSTNSLTFMERDPVVALGPGNAGRSTGFAAGASFDNNNGRWMVGLFNTASGEDGNAIGGMYEGAARATYRFKLDDDASFVHVGASFASGSADGVQFRARPGTSLGNRLADTGVIADADAVQRFGGDVAGVFGPFSAQAEYIAADVDSVSQGDPGFSGGYVLVSYFLTGESRPYSNGSFSTVKPKSPWRGWGEGTGAWEMALKYSILDLDDFTNTGQELTLISAGVNWYLNSNTRITFNYTTGENDAASSVDQDSYGVRFQVTF